MISSDTTEKGTVMGDTMRPGLVENSGKMAEAENYSMFL